MSPKVIRSYLQWLPHAGMEDEFSPLSSGCRMVIDFKMKMGGEIMARRFGGRSYHGGERERERGRERGRGRGCQLNLEETSGSASRRSDGHFPTNI